MILLTYIIYTFGEYYGYKSLSSTYENIKTLKKIYNDDLYLIIGADNLIELNTWKNHTYLLENCKFIVFDRNGIDVKKYIKSFFENYENKFIIKKEEENL